MRMAMELLILMLVMPVWVIKAVASLRAIFRFFREV
jgi:hypothetical protein